MYEFTKALHNSDAIFVKHVDHPYVLRYHSKPDLDDIPNLPHWQAAFSEWHLMSRKRRKKMYMDYIKNLNSYAEKEAYNLSYVNNVTLPSPVCDAKQEGKTLMSEEKITNIDIDGSEDKKRKYLLDKIDNLSWYGKNDEIKKLFHVDRNNAPNNALELIDAIKNDKFKLDEKMIQEVEENGDGDAYYSVFYGFIWDGPKPDWNGYHRATKAFNKAKADTIDAVNVLPIAEAYEAYQALKNWKPDNAPAS